MHACNLPGKVRNGNVTFLTGRSAIPATLETMFADVPTEQRRAIVTKVRSKLNGHCHVIDKWVRDVDPKRPIDLGHRDALTFLAIAECAQHAGTPVAHMAERIAANPTIMFAPRAD